MPVRDEVDGVLITGVYGTGKSSLAAELADMLERHGTSYAALDLDWLTWFDTARGDDAGARTVFLKNLGDVVGNYLAAGVEHFVLAGAVRDHGELADIATTLAFPLRVVRLNVPLDEIERRLRADVTTGRRDDLRTAATWIAESIGGGIEDLALDNDGSIHDLAAGIVHWLGWTDASPP